MFECVGRLDLRAILIWKSDADILGLQQKVREERETGRCQRPGPADTSRARGLVRKKSAHASCRGWSHVGANQMLKILGDTEQLLVVQVEGVGRVERGTCDHPHCRRAAAVSVMRAGSVILGWVGRSRRGHERPRRSRGRPL